MKITCFIAVLLVAFSSAMAQDLGEIRNFLRVNKDFCTGGQPKLEHLEKLKAEGVKSIINLRQPSEHRAAEEEAKAKELGLKYFNIPVAYGNPNEEQVAEFLKITDDPENRPAFIHCTAAIRVGAEGALVPEGRSLTRVPVPRATTIADEVGAGDGFAAGFAYGLLQGWPPERCAAAGNLIAAAALTGTGDWETFPRIGDVARELERL